MTTITTPGSLSYEFDPGIQEKLNRYILDIPDDTDPVVRRLLIQSATDNMFGIRNLSDPTCQNPIPYVTKDDNLVTDSIIESTYKKIIDLNMPSHTGMNLDELLSLPSHEFTLLVKICRDKEERQRREVAKFKGVTGPK